MSNFSVARPSDELLTDEQRERFDQPGGEDDLYLWFMHSPMALSEVYFVGGEPAPYVADFYLRVEPAGEKTRVEVETVAPEVIAGKTLLPRAHMSRANIYVAVEPTTVEEYRLLRGIGEELGGQAMPDLRLPD